MQTRYLLIASLVTAAVILVAAAFWLFSPTAGQAPEIRIPAEDVRALSDGLTIIAFVDQPLAVGEFALLVPDGTRAGLGLDSRFLRLSIADAPGTWPTNVVEVWPIGSLSPQAMSGQHILAELPDTGFALALRVLGAELPVLTDEEFGQRLEQVRQAAR